MKEEPAEALLIRRLVTEALAQLGVPHAVVGPLASSLHGIPRSTNDADIVAALRPEHVAPLASALGEGFTVDPDMIRDAIARRSEFNVIHLATMFKVDVFVPALDPVAQAELRRATMMEAGEGGSVKLRVATAEDTIARKLRSYREGGEVSERQWADAVGVIAVQGEALDMTYLSQTADALGIRRPLGSRAGGGRAPTPLTPWHPLLF
jgi:hypothetical protein